MWEERDKMFFFSTKHLVQQLSLCAEALNTHCPSPAGSVAQLPCQPRTGHLDLPLDASLGCKTMLSMSSSTGEEEACPAGRRMCSVPLSVPALTALLPWRARASGMEKLTSGFQWTLQDIAGMKRVFEWVLEVRGHSLRERLCKM